MTKAEAGRIGGQHTVERHGKDHMVEIARKGAQVFHERYYLAPVGSNDFAIVNRKTNEPIGKTINGSVFR